MEHIAEIKDLARFITLSDNPSVIKMLTERLLDCLVLSLSLKPSLNPNLSLNQNLSPLFILDRSLSLSQSRRHSHHSSILRLNHLNHLKNPKTSLELLSLLS
jgi:hypothetical protein